MLQVRFHETGEIMEWEHGGLTKKRFEVIKAFLLDAMTWNGRGQDYYSGCASFGDYCLYGLIKSDGTGSYSLARNGEELFNKRITNAYWDY